MLTIHKESHLDHGLTQPQIDWLLSRYAGANAFFKETVELPEELGTVPCALMGPIVGDMPIPESEVYYRRRESRDWESRCIEVAYPRKSRKVTIVAGPHDGQECIIYTVYGGPEAPQEPGDPNCRDKEVSAKFWSEHALGVVVSL